MKHNIPLNILDEYAKTLTSKQVKKLYEAKCKKTYKKPLYENMKYQSDDNYQIRLTKYILEKSNSSIRDILANYANKYDLQYNIVNEDLYLYTPSKIKYKSLVENLINTGFNKQLLISIQNQNARKLIVNI